MKKVVITGGSRGIGASCVEKFASNGYEVAFLYRSCDAKAFLLKEKFPHIIPVKCDVASESDVDDAFRRIFNEMGDPDILVNNAGVSYSGLLQDMTLTEWKKVIDTNLTSLFLCSRRVIPSMVRRKEGTIINISSMWGIQGASCEVAYSASKAGVIGFTKALAMELAPSGIRVNAVAPGAIKTDMLSSYNEDELDDLAQQTPLGRIGTTEDIAEAVYFLAGDKAEFITGEVINVNGGFII